MIVPFQLTLAYIVFLPVLGAAVAALGTMVGLGGGFVLVPILILLFPEASPVTLTAMSLTMIFMNAVSATIGNLRAKSIDFRTAWILLIGAVPGAIAGSLTARVLSRADFERLFGVLLIVGAVYILWRGRRMGRDEPSLAHLPNRSIQERRGKLYVFYVNGLLAAVVSPLAGFVSSLFGIGGGIIHIPALTFILKVPIRVAGSTSLLVLAFTSSAALLTLLASGAILEGWRRAGLLGLGAVFGAQLGLYLSRRVNQTVVLLILSAALFISGLRMLL